MIIVGVVRIATGLLPNLPNNDTILLFYFGYVFEVLSTAMEVAHQFMALKDQRDRAKRDAELMEYMAQHDALTGLFNRRALVDGFRDAVDRGYHKIAELDIEHFKAVNDQYGHGTDDEVIRVAGAALQFDENVLVYRIGGEEFILLLRCPTCRPIGGGSQAGRLEPIWHETGKCWSALRFLHDLYLCKDQYLQSKQLNHIIRFCVRSVEL